MLKAVNLITLFGLLALSSAANSQSPSRPAGPAPDGDALVTMTYDTFEDLTTVSVEIKPAKVSDSEPNSDDTLYPIPLSARFACPGRKTKCAPVSILVSYEAEWNSLARCDSLPVTFIADGFRYKRGECRWLGSIVTFHLAPSDLASFGNAKRLEAKIGLWIFSFDENALQAMRALSEHIEIPAPPTKPGHGPK